MSSWSCRARSAASRPRGGAEVDVAGRVLGAFIVLSITLAAPRIGTFATLALIITGQLVVGTVIDRYGLFGLKQIPFTPYRIAGIILLAVGARWR